MPLLTPALLKNRSDVLKILDDWPFDFVYEWPSSDPAGFELADDTPFEIVGGDGAGNRFALLGASTKERRPLLYVDHDGAAGVIADSFHEGMQIIVDIPYWRDVLKFSGGGQLEPMQRAVPHLERDIQEEVDDIEGLRETVRRELALEPLSDAAFRLHRAVAGSAGRPQVMWDGQFPCDSLFGRFVPEDNPKWRTDAP